MKNRSYQRGASAALVLRLSALLCATAILQPVSVRAEPPTIEHAMKALQSELASVGPGTETTVLRDAAGKESISTVTFLYSDVSTIPATCTLRYHIKIVQNGKVVRDATDETTLRNPKAFYLLDSQSQLQANLPNQIVKETPRAFNVQVLSAHGAPFNYASVDIKVAARVWSEVATVVQLCDTAE